jgi:peroxiredoxin
MSIDGPPVTLRDELDGIAATLAGAEPTLAAAAADFVGTLEIAGMAAAAPRPGDLLPGFALPDGTGLIHRLHDHLAEGALVISFFCGSWCPFCRAALRALGSLQPRFTRSGAGLVAISPQIPVHNRHWVAVESLSIIMLSDPGNAYARRLGIAVHLPEGLRRLYRERLGIDLGAINGDRRGELPLPATFVIDHDARVLAAVVPSDPVRRMDPAAALAVLGAAGGPGRPCRLQ